MKVSNEFMVGLTALSRVDIAQGPEDDLAAWRACLQSDSPCSPACATLVTTGALMNSLPAACDVLVIGAGPAGSACAQRLAQAGRNVLLVDQQTFPRDKVCGEGLIPDAHAALAKLGVLDEVLAQAHPVEQIGCIGPRGGRVDVPGRLAVLSRRVLDDLLCQSAQRAGARFVAPWRFEALLREGGQVVGARLVQGEQTVEVRAGWVVMATGAVPQALIAGDLCERRSPSAVALRGLVHHPGMVGRITAMEMVWHPRLPSGYGWIFPGPDGVFNIGVGVMRGKHRASRLWGRPAEPNLREMFQAFCELHAPAGELMAGGTVVGEIKGAPLRFSLEGARWHEPGLLVTGEAAGSTYALTGEGIGKALETGMLAAQAIAEGADVAQVQQRYEASLTALKHRFDLYEKANLFNSLPWLADLVIWRARRSPGLRRRLGGVLEETVNPARLFTPAGLWRLFRV
jgi:menaquinone-9 beta-reductase